MSRARTPTISVIGLGYIGLPTACFLAQSGYRVVGVDVDVKKIDQLRRGSVPFDEPGLFNLLRGSLKNLSFSLKPVPADIFLIAVPTPLTKKKDIDLRLVKAATRSIVPVLRKGNLVVLESTVAPGNTTQVVQSILHEAGVDYDLVYCPERAFPGKTLHEMVYNDRLVGGVTRKAALRAKKIYEKFAKGNIFITDAVTAELVKVLENAYRNVNIAFANEMAKFAHHLGVDIWEAIALANRHPRVNIHSPGPGVGGHCIPLDPWFVVGVKSANVKFLKHALLLNESKPRFVVDLFLEAAKKRDFVPRKVAIFGVAYKKDVDDARETPAYYVATQLAKLGYDVRCTDPYVKHFSFPLYSQSEVLVWADAVIIVTDHTKYRSVPFDRYGFRLVLDTRNTLTAVQIKKLGNACVILGNGKRQ